MTAVPQPNACRWCHGPAHHARKWHYLVGWHDWEPPTDTQRDARARRTNTPEEKRP